jgi:hypothetical protein
MKKFFFLLINLRETRETRCSVTFITALTVDRVSVQAN